MFLNYMLLIRLIRWVKSSPWAHYKCIVWNSNLRRLVHVCMHAGMDVCMSKVRSRGSRWCFLQWTGKVIPWNSLCALDHGLQQIFCNKKNLLFLCFIVSVLFVSVAQSLFLPFVSPPTSDAGDNYPWTQDSIQQQQRRVLGNILIFLDISFSVDTALVNKLGPVCSFYVVLSKFWIASIKPNSVLFVL